MSFLRNETFFVLLAVITCFITSSQPQQIIVDTKTILTQTDEKFLSIALDSHIIQERWKNFDFTSKRTLNLAKGLSPGYLRLGGTAADLVIFSEKSKDLPRTPLELSDKFCYCTTSTDENEKVCEDLNSLYSQGNFTMTGMDWIKINKFAKMSGLTLLFDFNVLLRRPNGRWNSKNAKEILTFSSKMGYDDIAWELGNEPNSLQTQLGVNISGFQLGKDYYYLKKLLSSFPLYQNSTLVGPDINQVGNCGPDMEMPWPEDAEFAKPCAALQYLEKVYQGSRGVIDAFTWHHYYMDGATANDKSFINPRNLDNLVLQFEGVSEFLKEQGWSNKNVWLGETASGYSGGTFGLSDRFASGLLWLNKLGLAAAYNYKVVIRQTFYHGCYALTGEDGFPNPDYWVSAIYKKLVSNKVLNVTLQNLPPVLRIYGHCTPKSENKSGVTLFGVNMANQTFQFSLEPEFATLNVSNYYLTPLNGNLTSRIILLNGQALKVTEDDDLPDFEPVMTPPSSTLTIPAFAMVFWVFEDLSLKICN